MSSESDIEIPLNYDHARDSSGSFSEGDDIFLTINGNDFMAIEQPRPLGRMESLQREKQISVDPISVRGPAIVRQASFTLVSPLHPAIATPPGRTLTLPHPPPKLKFVSTSLPSSASSSPRSGSTSLLKKIWENQNEGSRSPRPTNSRDESDLALQQGSTRRSRSMSGGGAADDDFEFDLTLEKPSTKDQESVYSTQTQPTKQEARRDHDYQPRRGKERDVPEGGFTCGKLCLFLPRGKCRPVKASSSSSVSPLPPRAAHKTDHQAISRTVSLERFDCGSLISEGEREPTNLFFDLPLEMIRCSVSDMQSPVTAAFVFDKDEKMVKEPKGVLKYTWGSPQERKSKSQDSTRHVRFSTSSPTTHPCDPSSPTCVTPRLRKAREEFSAFLDAQST